MAILISLEGLLTKVGVTGWLEKGLAVAEAVGLPVTSWTAGDPTRSYYHHNAEGLGELEEIRNQYVRSGFLDTAEGDWLKHEAKQVYNVDTNEASFATTDVVLTNTGGGEYPLTERSVTFRNGTTGKTYKNITTGTLTPGPGTTLTVTVEADEAGTASAAAAGEIDELVTTLLGVTCANPTAAVANDDEAKPSVVERCRSKTGALSPNGPRDAYKYIALTPEFTGTTGVTRARSVGDSDTGDVNLYIAGPSGPVSSDDRDAVEEAIVRWATPLTVTPTVANANAVVVNIAYQLWLYSSVGKTAAEVEEAVESALESTIKAHPIGGDIIPPAASGKLYRSLIATTIQDVFLDESGKRYAFRVEVTSPAADVDLDEQEVAVLGTVTSLITFVKDP